MTAMHDQKRDVGLIRFFIKEIELFKRYVWIFSVLAGHST